MVPRCAEHASADAGLLLDLADRGLLRRLALLEVALGQRPDQAAAAVVPRDERRTGDARAPVEDQAAGAGLVDAGQPGRGRAPYRPPARGRRGTRGAGHGSEDSRGPRRLGCRDVPPVATDHSDERAALVQRAVDDLRERAGVALELGERFTAAGHEVALVGGPVRDALLGRLGDDLDFTTDARPEQVLEIVSGWADAVWDIGIAFGTVGVRKGEHKLEITTYRADAYDRESRKPEVSYGDDARRRPRTPRLHRQRDGGAAALAGARRPARRHRRPRRRGAAHARHAGGVVQRRPAADAARGAVRLAAAASRWRPRSSRR